MAALVSAGAQNTAITAANAAANGAKRTAYLTSLISSIGSGPKLRLYRDGAEVWEADYSGSLAITDFGITIATGTQVSISDADINSGSWEFRVEKASDSSVYIGGTIDDTAATDVGAVSGDLEAAGTITYGTIRFNAPSLDTLTVAERQKSSLATGSNVSSFTVTLPAAAAVSNKLIIPFAWYEGFRGYTDPDTVTATLWLDPSDFSTMWTAVGGTGAVSAVGALVKRIDNKGSAGGCFVNATGWYLRQSTTQGYYLEMNGTSVFRSKAADGTTDKASSDFIAVGGAEVIVAVRPDSSAGSTDVHFAPGAWCAGDSYQSAGLTFHSSTVAKAFNYDSGTADVINLTHAQGADQIFTTVHTGGNLTAAVGFSSTPGGTVASGDQVSLADPFGIGGTYHGSHPMLSGRFYQIVAKAASLSTADRDFCQWYAHRKMVPNARPENLTITDNVGNVYPVIASKTDSAGKLWAGVAVAHTLIDSASAITATLQMPATKGFFVAGQAIEVPGLLGEASVDVVSTATNDGSAGSMTITTGTTAQASEFAVAVFALYNSDTAANISAPSGYTLIGATQNATSPLAMSSAYKVLTSAGAQVVTGAWDSGSAGGAVGVVVTFKAGVNTDTPGSGTGTGTGAGPIGPGGSSASTTVALIKADYTDPHEVNGVAYAMNGVPTTWDWGVTGRAGALNVAGWSSAPAITPWFHLATRAGHVPGPHNWRVAIVGIYHHEKRGGVWQVLGTQATAASQITGAQYLNYQTNQLQAANVRTSNGIWEVYVPNEGGTIHGYPTYRIPASPDGATARATVIAARLTLDNAGGTDDRSGAQVMLLAGFDWWRSMTQQWEPGGASNIDGGIGRARKPSITTTPSLHFQHTMGTDETAIGEYVTFLSNIGLIT